MESTPTFGPNAQTREQRQQLCDKAAAISATQGQRMEPFAVELRQRYIEGEMSLREVIAEVNRIHRRKYLGQDLPEATAPAIPPPFVATDRE